VTTTIEDSGLLAALVAAFEEEHPGIVVRAITGGTGDILEYARRGDVDVVITHDPVAESTFVAQGHARERRDLMYNHFLLAGAINDPADLRNATDAADAFRRMAAAETRFVSRGDDSGTHRRERAIWRELGIDPSGRAWYIEAGSGMGDALRLANNRRAYVLTDEGTFLTLKGELELEMLYAGDSLRLLNRYGVMPVHNPRRPAEADSLVNWLTDARGRGVIAGFGVAEVGRSLFIPYEPGER